VRDSVMAITDESYFDWPVLPEAPSSLEVAATSGGNALRWQGHGGNATGFVVERRIARPEGQGKWERIAKAVANTSEYTDTAVTRGARAAYRVRAVNAEGESAYSNIARVR
jgi:hypothetical protein